MLVQKDIKNIYLWEYKDPITPTFELSYDFRNKSWTNVQNDWWTLIQWTSWTTINSNWINMPTRWQGNSNKVRISYPIDLNDVKKITLEATYYGVDDTRWCSFDYSTRLSSNFDTWWTSISWSTTTASGYMWRWGAYTPNTSVRYDNSPQTWTRTSHAEFDLVNKTITFYRNWLSTLTWTISDTDIATIKGWNIIAINWWHDIWTLRLYTIYIKIEY